MFLESILFLQKIEKFQKQCCLFWRLSRGSSQSRNSDASSRVNFGDLFTSERSSREGYIEISAAQLATPSQVDLPVAKTLKFFFLTFVSLSVLTARLGNLLAIHPSREKRVFGKNWVSF